jgi:hypothetical protein
MSAWWKVFLRNGFFITAYLTAFGFLVGGFPGQGWPFGLSETMNQVPTFAVLIPLWFAMIGGVVCVFRRMVQWMVTEAALQHRRLPTMRCRWLWSYFLEIDQEHRLRQ